MIPGLEPLLRRGFLPGILLAAAVVGCGDAANGSGDGDGLTGEVRIDGSSTVFPVSEALAEEFQLAHPDTRVTVGKSGTGGGLQRFCAGEIDIADASRPITPAEEERCRSNGVEFIRLPVAWDGLSVVTNPANEFVECLTLEELGRIWQPDSDIETWQDVRPSWPAEEIQLYGPGTDSGTFDYFTEEVVGEVKASRTDYQASEDDNVLVQGVAGDASSLGYFGYAFFVENREQLKLLAVDAGDGCIRPTDETIGDGSYPLARPLYIYVATESLREPTVAAYARFAMESAEELVAATGYHPLPPGQYQEALERIDQVVDASGGMSGTGDAGSDGDAGGPDGDDAAEGGEDRGAADPLP